MSTCRKRHTYILDVDVEGGAFAWASSLVLDLNALVLLAQWSTARAARAAWLALAIGFLSLDEMVGVHERIGGVLGAVMQPRGSFYFVWLAPALVAVAALAIVFRSFRLHLPRRMAWQFVAAGGLYVGGAVGVEMISGVVAEGGSMQRRRRNLKNGPHTTDDLNRAQLAPIQRQ